MHSTHSGADQKSSHYGSQYTHVLGDAEEVKSYPDDAHWKEEGTSSEAWVVLDLEIGFTPGHNNCSIANEVHGPDSYRTHCTSGSEQEVPCTKFKSVTGEPMDANGSKGGDVDVPIIISSGTRPPVKKL